MTTDELIAGWREHGDVSRHPLYVPYARACAAFLAGLEEWHPASERPAPPDGGRIMTVLTAARVDVRHVFAERIYDAKEGWGDDRVTHWIPIPSFAAHDVPFFGIDGKEALDVAGERGAR